MQNTLTKRYLPQIPVPFLRWRRDALKRAFDVFISMVALLLLSPLFAIVAIIIKRQDPGPVFYRGKRMGRGGKPFEILKFRTMRECPESYQGPRITAKDDERVTPLGRWLRKSKLNELPQLWNVLKGEMSLVGPRPEDYEIANTWPLEARNEILSVRPGITSPASVLYRHEEDLLSTDGLMDAYFRDILPDKLRLDRLYVRNHSFMTDLDVIFWTVLAVLPLIAPSNIAEGKLFAGPLYRFFRRQVSWFFIDLIVSMAAITAAFFLWRIFEVINWGALPLAVLALSLATFFSGVNALLKLDRVVWSRAGAEDALFLLASNGIAMLGLFLLNYSQELYSWIPLPPLPMEMIFLISMLTAAGFLLARYRTRLLVAFVNRWAASRRQTSGFGERVLIIGAGEAGQIIHWLLQHGQLRRAFNVIGMVDDDLAKQGMSIDNCPVLGITGDIPSLVKKLDVGIIIFAITNLSDEARETILKLCHIPGVRLVWMNDILGSIMGKLSSQTA